MTGILVLGKNGQVGQELVRVFGDTRDVTAMGRAELDLADQDAIRTVLRALRPKVVINAAAFTAVDEAELKPAEAMAINRDAPAVIAQELKAWGAALIHYSTDYVFDGRKSSSYTEADVPAPLNAYGKSKLAGEQAIRDAGGACLILRASWVYGASAHNFCRTIWRLAREREELRVVCDQTGSPTWAATIARATRTLVEKCGDGIYGAREIYHLAAAGETTRHEFATRIIELLSRRFGAGALRARQIIAVASGEFQTRAMRPRYSVLSSAKLQSGFGIELPRWDEDLAAFIGSTPADFWQQDPPPA